ncbi:AraC family transcriptional regulator [Sphingomonas sp. CGMCC 1.13654]|uniref:AraC family transcriptional regulator n=1 Tax=Sphingomonas chungangi TaxID=2683589 RepID=A0A838LBJ6_9SPHN|nr:AraC family transcriptional regulator [Sphingomonas chungangi]MBA2936584.1 AraC family transcriptional regulator [Sphingomonas chungangi]MVW55969.1 helix-turn-helix domain-containing protein [Sphingomonas chungangi]
MDMMLEEMRALVARHAGAPVSPRLRLTVSQSTAPTPPTHGLYQPMLCFVLQGGKRVIIGDRMIDYRAGHFLVASVDLPVIGQVTEASTEKPYMVVGLKLDPAAIAALLIDLPHAGEGPGEAGISISAMTADLLDPLLRMMRLLDTPGDVPVMAPMLEREILYRVLQGPQGAILRQIARSDSRLSQVRRAIEWIRQNYAEPLRVEQLAGLAGMSASSFHRHFKAVTAMSPLAYHKQIRLQEARRRLIAAPAEAARVAYAVGYESASQFSREYARMFGRPPMRDAARLRAGQALEDA